MNNQGTQKNPVRKAKTSGQIRRPLSHRVMSMLLTFLMVFTTVMPYTAFAEDSVLTDGAGDMELVGVSSGANGTEAEIVDASGDGESSLITDQADASSASGAQGSDSSAASGAGSDGSADASLDGLFEDEPDAASTDTAASEDTGAANTYLNEDTRTVYLVNRNSYADLQLWNENKTGDEADFWVQHVEKPGTDKEYDLYGSVTTDENGDVVPTDYAGSTSYRFEEIKLEKTEKKDAKGGDIYSADIPESWEYVVFSYFADDADLKEDTKLDDAGYPVSTASNGRHRTMVIKVDDKKTWTVFIPLTGEEKEQDGIADATPAWTQFDIARTSAPQAFYVGSEHFEDSFGKTYRKPMIESLDGKDEAESETTEETSSESETPAATAESTAETAVTESETASTETEIAAETSSETTLIETTPSEMTLSDETETEATASTEPEIVAPEETKPESEEAEEVVAPETESETDTQASEPVLHRISAMPRRVASPTTNLSNYIFLDTTGMTKNNLNWTTQSSLWLRYYNTSANRYSWTQSTGKIDNSNVFYWDVSSLNADDTFFFTYLEPTDTNWSTMNSGDFYRTTDLGKISEGKGYVYTMSNNGWNDSNINHQYYQRQDKVQYTTGLTLTIGEKTVDLTSGTGAINWTSDVTLNAGGDAITASLTPGYVYTGYTYAWSVNTTDTGVNVSATDGTSTTITASEDAASVDEFPITITWVKDSATTSRTVKLRLVGKAADYDLDKIAGNTLSTEITAGDSFTVTAANNTIWTSRAEDTGAAGMSTAKDETLESPVSTVYFDANTKIYVKGLKEGTTTLTAVDDTTDTTYTINLTIKPIEASVDAYTDAGTALDVSQNKYYTRDGSADNITWTVSGAGIKYSTDNSTFTEVAAGNTFTTKSTDYLYVQGVNANDVATLTGGNYKYTINVTGEQPVAKDKTVYFWTKVTTYSGSTNWWINLNNQIRYSVDGKTWETKDLKVSDTYYDTAATNGVPIVYEYTVPADAQYIQFTSGSNSGNSDNYTEVISDFEDGDVFYINGSIKTGQYNNNQSVGSFNVSDGYTYTVKKKATTITVTPEKATLVAGETEVFTATVDAASTTQLRYNDNTANVLKWSSANESVATSNFTSSTGAKVGFAYEEEDSSLTDDTMTEANSSAVVVAEDNEKTQSVDVGVALTDPVAENSVDAAEEGTAGDTTDLAANAAADETTDPTAAVYDEDSAAPLEETYSVRPAYMMANSKYYETKTYKGVGLGTTVLNVTGADAYNEGKNVSAGASIEVVGASLTPSFTIDVFNYGSGDSAHANTNQASLALTFGNITNNGTEASAFDKVTKIEWTTDYKKGDGVSTESITVTGASGETANKWKNVIVTGSKTATDLPATLKVTATVHYDLDGDGNEDYSEVYNSDGTITNYDASGKYIYYDATLSRLEQAGDGQSNNQIPLPSGNNNGYQNGLWVKFYDQNKNPIGVTYSADAVNYGHYAYKEGSNGSDDILIRDSGADFHAFEQEKTVGSNTFKYVYKIPVPTNARYVKFANSQGNLYSAENSAKTGATDKLKIPTTTDSNDQEVIKGGQCFYADTADPYVYWSKFRSGYWDSAYKVRDPKKENSEKKTNNAATGGTPAQNSVDAYGTKKTVDNNGSDSNMSGADLWVDSSFYDYYSDVELDGLNRSTITSTEDNWANVAAGSHRTYVTFRQFDQALSDYYDKASASIPMYTGHFQPDYSNWGTRFSAIKDSMNLFGYNNYNGFFSTNNSTIDSGGNGGKYDEAAQGLISDALIGGALGTPALKGSTTVTLPYFNEAFLNGANTKNAVLGRVYNNVQFPFTKYDRDANGVMYYGFDSARTTLHLENGYLKTTSQADYVAAIDDTSMNTQTAKYDDTSRGDHWSLNTTSQGVNNAGDKVSNKYGFFPLNNVGVGRSQASAMTNNYGFGTKLDFQFSLTSDGNVKVTNEDGSTSTYPMTFTFSGDDDVWVFIDGKLVLDIGGDHGRVSGCINFSKGGTSNQSISDGQGGYKYNYTTFQNNAKSNQSPTVAKSSVYVSKVKSSQGSVGSTPATKNLSDILGAKEYADLYTGQHQLTMFYMERGQWESNMKVEFNMIPSVSIKVNKNFTSNNVDITSSMNKSNQKVYAMITRHKKSDESSIKADGSQDTEIVAIPGRTVSGSTDAEKMISKYLLTLSPDLNDDDVDTNWTATATGLDKYASTGDLSDEYVYHVWEVAVDDNGNPKTTGGQDSAGIKLPTKAVKGDSVKVGSYDFTFDEATIHDEGDMTKVAQLTNSRNTTTKVKVTKVWDGADNTTMPDKIYVKLQRHVIGNSTTDWVKDLSTDAAADAYKLTLPTIAKLPKDGWEDVGTWVEMDKPTDNSTSWEKTFSGLLVSPDNDSSNGEFYMYRLLEATKAEANTANKEADEGQTVTYGNNSYWVHYSGTSGSGSNTQTWAYVTLGVNVTRKGVKGSYTYTVDDTLNNKTLSYPEKDVEIHNTLIVHLPSTGSRTGMTLTILSLICLAAAGTFGIFGRKKETIE